MARQPGLSVRLKLTLSYAAFLMFAGAVLLAVVWVFLLRYVPDGTITSLGGFVPNRSDLQEAFAPRAAAVMAFLLLFGLVGGWLLAGRMLAPLSRITDATRRAASGSLSHRIRLPGRSDEFRELADAFDTMLARLEDQLAEQQRFAANASHELRTPLAITQSLLDVPATAGSGRGRPHRAAPRGRRPAIHLTEALLLSAAPSAPVLGTRRPALIAEEASETLLPLAEKHGVTIETSGDVTPASAPRAAAPADHEPGAQRHRPQPPRARQRPGRHRSARGRHPRRGEHGDTLAPQLVSTLTEPFQRDPNVPR